MNCWEVLGIEPTQNKKEIKKAYAKLLKQYHPEENPEEFKQIQEAYQQCLHPEQDIESVSYKQEERTENMEIEPISIREENEIVPPPVPKVETLFVKNEKDVVVYQDILNSIEKSLPKKIGSKEIVQVFTNPQIKAIKIPNARSPNIQNGETLPFGICPESYGLPFSAWFRNLSLNLANVVKALLYFSSLR